MGCSGQRAQRPMLLLLLLATATAAAARQLRQGDGNWAEAQPQEAAVQWTDPEYNSSTDGLYLAGGWEPLPEELAPAAAEALVLSITEVVAVEAWAKPAACDELSDEEFDAAFAQLGAACPSEKPYSCPGDCLPAMQALDYRCASAAAKAAARAVGFDPRLAAERILYLFKACPLALLDTQENTHLPPAPPAPPPRPPPPSPPPFPESPSPSPEPELPVSTSPSPELFMSPVNLDSPPPPPPPPPPEWVPSPSPSPVPSVQDTVMPTPTPWQPSTATQPGTLPSFQQPVLPAQPVVMPTQPLPTQQPQTPFVPPRQPSQPSTPGVLVLSASGAFVKPPRHTQQQAAFRPLPQAITQAPTFQPQPQASLPQAGLPQAGLGQPGLPQATEPPLRSGMYNRRQVREHTTLANCWVIHAGAVYNLTPFINSGRHPGGNAVIRPFCGLEVTQEFNRVHTPGSGAANNALAFKIGVFVP